MTKWILDTDHYSLIQRNNPEVIDRFQEIDSKFVLMQDLSRLQFFVT
jgi:hypothetical protein